MTIYADLLGDDLGRLPVECLALHSDYGRFKGRISVSYARFPGVARLGQMFGFAPPAEDAVLTLDVERQGDQDLWVRNVKGQAMRSVLWVTENGLLAEKMGPATVLMKATIQGRQLHLQPKGFAVGSLSLPDWLAPQIEAVEMAELGRYRFEVTISLPLINWQLVSYTGWLDTLGAVQG